MILVLAGTRDGRAIVTRLADLGLPVCASVVSEYGRDLLEQRAIRVFSEAMDQSAMERVFRAENIRLLVDATHPYAVNVTRNAASAAESVGIDYIRYERPPSLLPDYEKLVEVVDMAEAVAACLRLGRTWFLTIGSRHVGLFADAARCVGRRVIARVLPQPDVIAECFAAGLSPADIIAMQGPFSQAMNEIMFQETGADIVVTKNSGEIGGTVEKIQAAISIGLFVVAVRRPLSSAVRNFFSIDALVDYIIRSRST